MVSVLLISCSNAKKKQQTSSEVTKIIPSPSADSIDATQTIDTVISLAPEEKKAEEKPFTITNKNLRSFFKEYGEKNKETKVKISTSFGDIIIKLFKKTPIHRANFIYLTKQGYFDTTLFYRVAKDFVIQGGNSESHEMSKKRAEIGDYTVPQEFFPELKHHRGMVALSKHWVDNPSNRSTPFEFFIVVAKKGAYHLDGKHTVFGKVIKGMHVADKIAKVAVDFSEWPKEDIPIKAEVID